VSDPWRARRPWIIAAIVAAVGVGWLGSVEWELSWAIPAVSASVGRWTGWTVEVRRLWAAPWRRIRAEEVFIQPAGGGRVHIRSVAIDYRAGDWLRGRASSRWWVRQIHVDPGSWKIRRPEAVASLTAGPVVDRMTLRMSIGWDAVTAQRIRARGSVLRFHGAGQWRGDGTMRGWVRGQVATATLAQLGLPRGHGGWEPFRFQVAGAVHRPAIQFKGRFLSLSAGGEKGS